MTDYLTQKQARKTHDKDIGKPKTTYERRGKFRKLIACAKKVKISWYICTIFPFCIYYIRILVI